jgi:hypothetical protein
VRAGEQLELRIEPILAAGAGVAAVHAQEAPLALDLSPLGPPIRAA